jgi:AcrR family transcriptional regulator
MRSPRNGHRTSAKDSIRRAAAQLFAEKGFAATSTREICEHAGITKPVLYYHFGNKEELYESLVQDCFNEFQGELRRASHRGRTTREKLLEVLLAMFTFSRRNHNEYRVAVRMLIAPERGIPPIDFIEMSRADERLLADVLREGVRKGEVRGSPKQIAEAICGIAFAMTMGYFLRGDPPLSRSNARDLINLLMEGCARKATPR